MRGESALHATRCVAYQKHDGGKKKKTLLARKCGGSAADIAHSFSRRWVSGRREEGGKKGI